jgi:hypothetical protein
LSETIARVDAQQEGLQTKTAGEPKRDILSDLSISRRRKLPTSIQIPARTKIRRVQETFQAALEINGGAKENPDPALVGMIEMLSSKSSRNAVVSAVCDKEVLVNHITSTFHGRSCAEYEKGNENMLRSVTVYYGMGVMGKRKYIKVRQSLSFKNVSSKCKKTTRIKVGNCSVPALVPYYKLAKLFFSDDKINGFYRNLQEYLPRLAEFYLKVYKEDDFDWFGSPFTFKVAIGGDGAPFGKNDQSCAWLVSFLNIGKRFLSSEDNFLIFGANCSGNCTAVEKYVSNILSDIIFGKEYFLDKRKNVKLESSELPNDMKMLCFLAGEMSNSAKYFSTFANVSYDDMSKIDFTFGHSEDDKWRPWVYEEQLSVAKQVENLGKKLVKSKLAKNTKRNKVTTFIAQKNQDKNIIHALEI